MIKTPADVLGKRQDILAYLGIVIAFFVVRSLVNALWNRKISRLPLPPGPKPKPILGNIFDLPILTPWLVYDEWCKTYGDVVYLHVLGHPLVILGTAETAIDLLDRRSNNYSDRKLPVMLELMRWDFNFASMPYSPRWRIHRRTFHQFFNSYAVVDYQHVQLREARAFLSRVLVSPEKTREHVREMVVAIILRIVYGMKITGLDDQYITLAQKAVEGLSIAVIPGPFWVEFMPFLKYVPSWVPGAHSTQVASAYRPIVQMMRNQPFETIEAAAANGTAEPSVAHALLQQVQEKSGNTDPLNSHEELEIAKNVTALAYSAAADTTTGAVEAFLLAMAMFPEVQKKAQDELDLHIGPNRLPDFSDLDNPVYIRAIALETMRWIPVTPLGVPHNSMAEDEYKGYRIPAGSTIFVAILHNPEDYPDPDRFDPDRFIKDGEINPEVRDPTTIAFGFGRRICAGRHLSSASLLIYIASMLHVFDIKPGVDESGNTVGLTMDAESKLFTKPICMPHDFRPRATWVDCLIREAVADSN